MKYLTLLIFMFGLSIVQAQTYSFELQKDINLEENLKDNNEYIFIPINNNFLIVDKTKGEIKNYSGDGKLLNHNLLNYDYDKIFNHFISKGDKYKNIIAKDFQYVFNTLGKNNYNLQNVFIKDSIIFSSIILFFPFLEINATNDSTVRITGYHFLLQNDFKGNLIKGEYIKYENSFNYFIDYIINYENEELIGYVKPPIDDLGKFHFLGKYIKTSEDEYELYKLIPNNIDPYYLPLFKDFVMSINRINKNDYSLSLVPAILNLQNFEVREYIKKDIFNKDFPINERKTYKYDFRVNSLIIENDNLIMVSHRNNLNFFEVYNKNNELIYSKKFPENFNSKYMFFLNEMLYYVDLKTNSIHIFNY